MLGRAHQSTNEDHFARAARDRTDVMADYMPRRAMFCGMNFHYAGFRPTTSRATTETGNSALMAPTRWSTTTTRGPRQIPLGTLEIESPAPEFRGPTAGEDPPGDHLGPVDAIYTSLPVLWRAYEETGEPVYRDTVVSHADRHLDWYIREDGRTWHHAEFDPETGELQRQYNEPAYSDETCWARGQGWCIADLARTYEETGAERYLDVLQNTVDYYVATTPDDLVPHWDFERPDKTDVGRDTSAAALAAYGLTRLTRSSETAPLVDIGGTTLGSLVSNYMAPRSPDNDRPRGMILEGCYNGPSGFADQTNSSGPTTT